MKGDVSEKESFKPQDTSFQHLEAQLKKIQFFNKLIMAMCLLIFLLVVFLLSQKTTAIHNEDSFIRDHDNNFEIIKLSNVADIPEISQTLQPPNVIDAPTEMGQSFAQEPDKMENVNVSDEVNQLSILQPSTINYTSKIFPKEKLSAQWVLEKHAIIDHFIILPKYNLLFCAIPKAGSQSFHHFARRIQPYISDKSTEEWGNPRSEGLNQTDIQSRLESNIWTKIVFFRDPLERFLSGYLNKCVRNCCHVCPHYPKGIGVRASTKELIGPSFDTFIHTMRMKGLMYNPHFQPQSKICGKIESQLGRYDFIGVVNNITGVYHQMQKLQQKFEVLQVTDITKSVEYIFNRDVDNTGMYSHNYIRRKGTSHKRSDSYVEEYYTEYLRIQVETLYYDDYVMLKSLRNHHAVTEEFINHFQHL